MALLLGIDTGGTYTDAVLLDEERGVLASCKALTTRYDLTVGISKALGAAIRQCKLDKPGEDIQLVSLSTTLATNAIVEGQGSPICLILIGYSPDALEQAGLGKIMLNNPLVFVPGGHNQDGEETEPLDLGLVRSAIEEHSPRVAAFAVSGYFSVRNPEHENSVRQLIQKVCGLPVTCGSELSSNLHAARRAVTAALNARLIPLLTRLIRAVEEILQRQNIRAPLMVVKGDGTLVSSRFAMAHPIETILSGPAASVVGSVFLTDEDDACVVDMGGTTTDIALLRGGKPVLNREGATVGKWQTMVETVQVHTYGLGGDSEVSFSHEKEMFLGPRRAVPLSLLAHDFPEIESELKRQKNREAAGTLDGRFLVCQRPFPGNGSEFTALQRSIMKRVSSCPVALDRLYSTAESEFLLEMEIERLTNLGLVGYGAFTPTDASHALGYQDSWSLEAALLGAEIMARLYTRVRRHSEVTALDFCRRVIQQVVLQAGRAVVSATITDTHGVSLEHLDFMQDIFVDPTFFPEKRGSSPLEVQLTYNRPLIGLGAPVRTYFPELARGIQARLYIPEHAEIANAIGAVAGSIIQTVKVRISPQKAGALFRVHDQKGVRDFSDLEEAAAFAREQAGKHAKELAEKAGACSVNLDIDRRDHKVIACGQEIFLECEITAVAAGRPYMVVERKK